MVMTMMICRMNGTVVLDEWGGWPEYKPNAYLWKKRQIGKAKPLITELDVGDDGGSGIVAVVVTKMTLI
jgi:hypothetical protein